LVWLLYTFNFISIIQTFYLQYKHTSINLNESNYLGERAAVGINVFGYSSPLARLGIV
jgi:hypothetical protein